TKSVLPAEEYEYYSSFCCLRLREDFFAPARRGSFRTLRRYGRKVAIMDTDNLPICDDCPYTGSIASFSKFWSRTADGAVFGIIDTWSVRAMVSFQNAARTKNLAHSGG